MFSHGIERALHIAIEAHHGQQRKGSGAAPYVVHPVHVALMLARWGMGELVIQAAILHDVVEDCETWSAADIEREFGAQVAAIVAELTEDKSLGWSDRKRIAVEKVSDMTPEAAAVKAVDKLHNLESLLVDLDRTEDKAAVWASFRGGREGTLRYANELVAALEPRLEPALATSLRTALENLHAIA